MRLGSLSRTSLDPSGFATWTAHEPRERSTEKAIFFPSGDQDGVKAFRNSNRSSP
jgi:hypothetical protein